MAARPIFLHHSDIETLLAYLLSLDVADRVLIICASRFAFHEYVQSRIPDDCPLFHPDLPSILRNKNLRIKYCTSIGALHALLATLNASQDGKDVAKQRSIRVRTQMYGRSILAICNSVSLHKKTPSFSAQGLGKMIAAAISAANFTNRNLIFSELSGLQSHNSDLDQSEESDIHNGLDNEDAQFESVLAANHDVEEDHQNEGLDNIWYQNVPLTNTTTRTFGSLESAWLGRTVTIKNVFERWCEYSDKDL